MRRNQGFTLAEVLASIVVLAIIGIIVFPKISTSLKASKNDALQVQVNNIKKAANDWAYKNARFLPTEVGKVVVITVGTLKQEGYLPVNLRNPVDNTIIPNDTSVVIKRIRNAYETTVDLESGTSDNIDDINPNAPIIILNGNYITYTEINEEYIDAGVVAKTIDGSDITNQVYTQIMYENDEVSSVDTSDFNTYTINYTVKHNNISSKAIRTVIVNDTKPPVITFPENTTIKTSQVASFNPLSNVTIKDNSNLSVNTVVTSQLSNIPGKYIITYTATDTSGNSTVKKRMVTVVE